MRHRHSVILVLVLAIAAQAYGQAAPPSAPAAPQEQPKAAQTAPTPPARNDYRKPETWLCRPGRQDFCAVDMTTTVISADGKLSRETWSADPNAPIDCFYVYPTVSTDPGGNSDMIPGNEERRVILAQFARFASVCRPYAPLYRQITLTWLRAAASGDPIPVDRALAYNDVLDAWNDYLAHDNQGRGVILIGHSQGSSMLTGLVKHEIDGKPIQSRIVSVMLAGTNLPVPQGKDIGGGFEKIPLCHAASQTGCVIAYASFRSNAPPPANTRYGRVQGEGMMAACTNPAALGGGSGELHSYFFAKGSFVDFGAGEQKPWVTPAQPVDTPFVSVPGMLTAECVSDKDGSYLAITVHGDPKGPRVDDIAGDVVVGGTVRGEWGLHLIDVQEAMGNLIDIARQESTAYLASRASKTK